MKGFSFVVDFITFWGTYPTWNDFILFGFLFYSNCINSAETWCYCFELRSSSNRINHSLVRIQLFFSKCWFQSHNWQSKLLKEPASEPTIFWKCLLWMVLCISMNGHFSARGLYPLLWHYSSVEEDFLMQFYPRNPCSINL